jgi:hypothetical protein
MPPSHVPSEPLQIALGALNGELHKRLLEPGLVSVAQWNEHIAPRFKAVVDVILGSKVHARSYRVHESLYPPVSKPPRPASARSLVPIKVRPMLVSGMLATDERGPIILINSEEDPKQQVITLWHETLHLLGLKDESLVEECAVALAEACPDVLRKLAHNINVPDSNAPVPASRSTIIRECCAALDMLYERGPDRGELAWRQAWGSGVLDAAELLGKKAAEGS